MTDRELWQYALRTLISHQDMTRPLRETNDCIDKLETELAKLKQDAGKCACGANLYIDENGKPCSKVANPEQEFKYTEYGLRGDENGKLSIGEIPRKEWVGLTDEEMSDTYNRHYNDYASDDVGIVDFIVIARVIEAKLKELNT
jgi:hypothetical protein